MPGRQRLDRENIQTGVTQMTRTQRVDHRVLVHQRAARSVDQDRARPHGRDALAGQEVLRIFVQQQVHRQHVTLGE